MRDEELRELEAAAARGDSDAAQRLLGARYRRGEVSEDRLDLAAYLGFPPALALRPQFEALAQLDTQPWVDGLGRFGRGVLGRALLTLARELSPRMTPTEGFGDLALVPLRPSGAPCGLTKEETLVVGRSGSADLTLNDDRVSRRHCELQLSSEGLLVARDLGSTNGTFLGGEPLLEETALRVGQVLRLGSGALVEVRGGLLDPTPTERCLAAVQAALDDPCRATARAAAEVANALPTDGSSPEIDAALGAAYAVSGGDVLAGAFLAAIPAERCRRSARRALLPWVLSGGPLPPDPPETNTHWRSLRLQHTSWTELQDAIEDAFGVRAWAPLGDCDPRTHAQFVVQSTPDPGRIEILHVVDLQGLEPSELPFRGDWTAIRHANLASVRHVGTRRLLTYYPSCFCAREDYLAGPPVLRWVEEHSPDPARIVEFGIDLAKALTPLLDVVQHWHTATLTPGDVVVEEGRACWRGLVARAAISALDHAQTDYFRHRELNIDLRYLTPEQATDSTKAAPPRVVVYQLAMILYTLLAGQPPFPTKHSSTSRVLLDVLHQAPQPLSEVGVSLDPALDALLLRCLAKDPLERPSGPSELAALLGGAPLPAARAD
jgi:hypothetical protein